MSMKILELNNFMPWARDYGRGYEIERRLARGRQGEGRKQNLRSGQALVDSLGLKRISKGDFDLCVCSGLGRSYTGKLPGRNSKYLFERFLARCISDFVRRTETPLAVIDIADDLTIHPVNQSLLEAATIFFKRELALDPFVTLDSLRELPARMPTLGSRSSSRWQNWEKKLSPISLGCREVEPNRKWIPLKKRRWDVFYSGNDRLKPLRAGIELELDSLRSLGYRVRVPEKQLPVEEFLAEMSDSKLTLSPPGLGWDCHRHYEALMVGSVPVTTTPTIQREHPLLNGIHSLFYDLEKSLAPQLADFLSNQQRLERVARDGQNFVFQFHTHSAHFESVVERFCELRQ